MEVVVLVTVTVGGARLVELDDVEVVDDEEDDQTGVPCDRDEVEPPTTISSLDSAAFWRTP